MSRFELRGIEGVEGREPVGAILRVGQKLNAKSAPRDRDRFFIARPWQSGDKIRPLHHGFAKYNAAALEHRTDIDAVLVHATEEECLHYQLSAWRLPGQRPPPKGPACRGDGLVAIRQIGEDSREITCPNRQCEYRVGLQPTCKPLLRALFRPIWPEREGKSVFPTPLMRFESRSWNTVEAWVGFFRHIREQAHHLGVERPSLYGFRFQISLTEKTSPVAGGRKFPVVTPTPSTDVQSFLIEQGRRRQQLEAAPVGMLDPASHDPDEAAVVEVELSGAPAGGNR